MNNSALESIDINFDFTTDTPNFWDGFWDYKNGLGGSKYDPDALSKTLRKYHQALWSKPLPNGELMNLHAGSGPNYLTWKNFRFGSDSVIASFRYERYRSILKQIKESIPDYRLFMEDFIRRSYTIGGMIIFPKRNQGINQSRGFNPLIKDRWDLTLECIRRYYNKQDSPLYHVLVKDRDFFGLFVDFKGYVDFFYLQDCVSKDYSTVNFWFGNGEFAYNPLPQTAKDYRLWLAKELDFVEKRNARIQAACND